MSENKNAKTPADGPEYERGFIDGMQRQMRLHVNRVIKTWSERCEEHPDHQERIISERMIQARMQKEIDELRQALETEQEPVAWISEGGDVSRSKRYMDEMGFKCNPLYTAPSKQWVGLTDEEIAQGLKESWVTEQAWQSAVWWAEAKLKEKNHG